jgi:hypothetical protein
MRMVYAQPVSTSKAKLHRIVPAGTELSFLSITVDYLAFLFLS